MKNRTCGECYYVRGDIDGKLACFRRPPYPDVTAPRYRWHGRLEEARIHEGTYPAVQSVTPACGEFRLAQQLKHREEHED